MSTKHTIELPDPVYGGANIGPNERRRLHVSNSDKLIHAFAGGLHIAMSERNWRAMFAAIATLSAPAPIRRITFDDFRRLALAETETL